MITCLVALQSLCSEIIIRQVIEKLPPTSFFFVVEAPSSSPNCFSRCCSRFSASIGNQANVSLTGIWLEGLVPKRKIMSTRNSVYQVDVSELSSGHCLSRDSSIRDHLICEYFLIVYMSLYLIRGVQVIKHVVGIG